MLKDKHRDIARGVLPSTARKGARDNKRNYKAKQRHAQHAANRSIQRSMAVTSAHGTVVHDPELFDDFEDREIVDGYHASTKKDGSTWDDDMSYIVSRRRDADKLGPLLSWARAIERREMVGWDDEDKVAYFKAVLPDTLQGRHAFGHIKQALDLDDEFGFRFYNFPDPITDDEFRAAVARHLASTKSRQRLREFILDTVPVAGHSAESNFKVKKTVPAVDENGAPRMVEARRYINGKFYTTTVQATAEVLVPRVVAVTCDDCSFLRNDPLATTEAINRFIDIVWNHGKWRPRYRSMSHKDNHQHYRALREFILG